MSSKSRTGSKKPVPAGAARSGAPASRGAGSARGAGAAGSTGGIAAGKLQQAVSLHRQGQLEQAERLYREILQASPADHNALYFCGLIAQQKGDYTHAADLIGQALQVQPRNAEMFLNHGKALMALERFGDAAASFEKAFALQPELAEAFFWHGNALRKLQQPALALPSYDQAIRLRPTHAPSYSSSGMALKSLGRMEPAVHRFDQAIALQPDYVFAYAERAQALIELDRIDAALASYDEGLKHAPGHAEISAQKSLLLLLRGDFAQGWPLYEARWQCAAFASNRRNFSRPRWCGQESLAGKTLLLHAEQGLGDTIQFCRYATLLAAAGARVLLEAPPALHALLASLQGVAGMFAPGAELPDFDYYCPFMSLPAALSTSLHDIPFAAAYLRAPPQRLALWEERLGARVRPRVGLVWRGGSRHANDARRSIALAELLPHLPAGFDYFSLQKEVRQADQATLALHPALRHFGEQLGDFGDTAALAAHMDVVISVDTSVAHLCGALGLPTLLLLPCRPDWRWMESREDSPWYASMRLLRQHAADDWSAVFSRLAGQLGRQININE